MKEMNQYEYLIDYARKCTYLEILLKIETMDCDVDEKYKFLREYLQSKIEA